MEGQKPDLTFAVAFNRYSDTINAIVRLKNLIDDPESDPRFDELEQAEDACWAEFKEIVNRELQRKTDEYQTLTNEIKQSTSVLTTTADAVAANTSKINNANRLLNFLNQLVNILNG